MRAPLDFSSFDATVQPNTSGGTTMRVSLCIAILLCAVCPACTNIVSKKSFNDLHGQVEQQKKQLERVEVRGRRPEA